MPRGAPENREVAGDTALYFDATDPSSLRSLLRRISGDRELAAELGARAAVRARERYSWERVSAEYARLVRELLSARGSAR